MNNEEFEKKLNEIKRNEVLIFDEAGYVYLARIEPKIKKNKKGFYRIDEYDHKHDYWSYSYVNPDEIVDIKIYDYKLKTGYEGIKIEPMEIPDFPEEEISKCKQDIEIYLEDHDIINPWEYADKNNINVKLILLCVDRLISENKLELSNE